MIGNVAVKDGSFGKQVHDAVGLAEACNGTQNPSKAKLGFLMVQFYKRLLEKNS